MAREHHDTATAAMPPCAIIGLTQRAENTTNREREVLGLLARGATDAEIGAELSVAHRTVRVYITSLLAKMSLGNRTQLALIGQIVHIRECEDCKNAIIGQHCKSSTWTGTIRAKI